MTKEEFQRALQEKLTHISIDERREWNTDALFVWFMKAQREDSYLRWDRCPGDVWQWVPGFCEYYYGKNACY